MLCRFQFREWRLAEPVPTAVRSCVRLKMTAQEIGFTPAIDDVHLNFGVGLIEITHIHCPRVFVPEGPNLLIDLASEASFAVEGQADETSCLCQPAVAASVDRRLVFASGARACLRIS